MKKISEYWLVLFNGKRFIAEVISSNKRNTILRPLSLYVGHEQPTSKYDTNRLEFLEMF